MRTHGDISYEEQMLYLFLCDGNKQKYDLIRPFRDYNISNIAKGIFFSGYIRGKPNDFFNRLMLLCDSDKMITCVDKTSKANVYNVKAYVLFDEYNLDNNICLWIYENFTNREIETYGFFEYSVTSDTVYYTVTHSVQTKDFCKIYTDEDDEAEGSLEGTINKSYRKNVLYYLPITRFRRQSI